MKERAKELKRGSRSARKADRKSEVLGFSDKATLDERAMWPTSYALKELTPVEESMIVALLKRAVGAGQTLFNRPR